MQQCHKGLCSCRQQAMPARVPRPVLEQHMLCTLIQVNRERTLIEAFLPKRPRCKAQDYTCKVNTDSQRAQNPYWHDWALEEPLLVSVKSNGAGIVSIVPNAWNRGAQNCHRFVKHLQILKPAILNPMPRPVEGPQVHEYIQLRYYDRSGITERSFSYHPHVHYPLPSNGIPESQSGPCLV